MTTGLLEPAGLILPPEGLALPDDGLGLSGCGWWELFDGDPADGKLKDMGSFKNLITRIGDQYYGERAAGISSPPAQVTGMQLGTGSTAASKTGAGAAMVTLVASLLVAIDGGFPTSALSGSSRRIQWRTTWAAGTATATGIQEVVLTNQSTGTQTAVPEANTISRAVLTSFDKGASDSLVITWNHDLLGA